MKTNGTNDSADYENDFGPDYRRRMGNQPKRQSGGQGSKRKARHSRGTSGTAGQKGMHRRRVRKIQW